MNDALNALFGGTAALPEAMAARRARASRPKVTTTRVPAAAWYRSNPDPNHLRSSALSKALPFLIVIRKCMALALPTLSRLDVQSNISAELAELRPDQRGHRRGVHAVRAPRRPWPPSRHP